MSDYPKGWWFPFNSRKAHYMINGTSLCGKWLSLGRGENFTPDNGYASPDDCKACRTKLNQLSIVGSTDRKDAHGR